MSRTVSYKARFRTFGLNHNCDAHVPRLSKMPQVARMQAEGLTEMQNAALTRDLIEATPALRRFASRFAGQDCEREDLVQSTLLLAWAYLGTFTPGRSMKSWAFRILHNVYVTEYRKRRGLPVMDHEILIELMGTEPTQEWAIRKCEVMAALDRMPAECRNALIDMGLGQSYEDAAARQGCTVGAMKTRVRRSRIALAAAIGRLTTL